MDSSLTDEVHKEALVKMLRRCRIAFAAPGETLGRTDKVLHNIKTGDNPAFKIPYRRLPLKKKVVAEEEIAKMLREFLVPALGHLQCAW